MTKMLDGIQRQLTGEAPPAPIPRLIGFTLTAIKPGEAVIELEATEAQRSLVASVTSTCMTSRARRRKDEKNI